MGTDRFTKLRLARIIYCFLLLASVPSCKPLSSGTKISAKLENYDLISYNSRYGEVRTTVLEVSPNETMAFSLKVAFSSPSRFCWLEVWRYPTMRTDASDYADTPDSGISYQPQDSGTAATPLLSPWSQPCPRTTVPTGRCAFTFTEDGDLQLSYRGGDGDDSMVWNSNTSGLGATTLELQDTNSALYQIGFGVIMLRDSSENVVWRSNSDVHTDATKDCFRQDSSDADSAMAGVDYLSTMLCLGLFCGVLFVPLPR